MPVPRCGLRREEQRFDDQRHDVGRLDPLADIDVVERAELHPVERDDVAADVELGAQVAAEIAMVGALSRAAA
jgi:hypothetical protein